MHHTGHESPDFASTILWLEDQKIRHYKIEDREQLRKIDEPDVWKAAYAQYKSDLGVPQLSSATEELVWILSYAIRLEYLDNADDFKQFDSAKITELKRPANPTMNARNPLSSMDMSSDEFEAGVRELARRLNIPHHTDHLIMLEAAARIVERHLTKTNDKPAATNGNRNACMAYHIKDADKYAFAEKDMDEAANILRLLQIHSVRHLQTVINETIVAVQNVTANPKTDTKIGKIGF